MIALRCSTVCDWFSALRVAAPMSYMLTVAMAFMRGSILAALMTKLPLPQMPMHADALAVDERLGAQVVDRRAEGLSVNVRRRRRCAAGPRSRPRTTDRWTE